MKTFMHIYSINNLSGCKNSIGKAAQEDAKANKDNAASLKHTKENPDLFKIYAELIDISSASRKDYNFIKLSIGISR